MGRSRSSVGSVVWLVNRRSYSLVCLLLLLLERRVSSHGSSSGSHGSVSAGATSYRTKNIGSRLTNGLRSLRLDGSIPESSRPIGCRAQSVVDRGIGIIIIRYLESTTNGGKTIELADGLSGVSAIVKFGLVDLSVSSRLVGVSEKLTYPFRSPETTVLTSPICSRLFCFVSCASNHRRL